MWFNPELTPEKEKDVSAVETVSAIKDDPTFESVLSFFSVPPVIGQISVEDVFPSDLSH